MYSPFTSPPSPFDKALPYLEIHLDSMVCPYIFSLYFLGTYFVPGAALGPGDSVVNEI